MNSLPLRVVKIGGSLFDLPQIATRIAAWLATQPAANNVLVVGGGALADAIRAADQTHALGEAVSHQLCLEVLSVTTKLFWALSQNSPLRIDALVASCSELQTTLTNAESDGCRVLFDIGRFAQQEEPLAPGTPLPHSWQVTSDSLAARLATLLRAAELVLLKSRLTTAFDRSAAVRDGLVDEFFPQACPPPLPVRIVNLRASDFAELRI